MSRNLSIRDAEEKDHDFILRINEEVLSPMPPERLELFKKHASVLQIAEADGGPAAFIICMREGEKSAPSMCAAARSRYLCKRQRYDRYVLGYQALKKETAKK